MAPPIPFHDQPFVLFREFAASDPCAAGTFRSGGKTGFKWRWLDSPADHGGAAGHRGDGRKGGSWRRAGAGAFRDCSGEGLGAGALPFFGIFFAAAWAFSRASKDALLLRWRPGPLVLPLGAIYSVAIRLIAGVVALFVVLMATAITHASPRRCKAFFKNTACRFRFSWMSRRCRRIPPIFG